MFLLSYFLLVSFLFFSFFFFMSVTFFFSSAGLFLELCLRILYDARERDFFGAPLPPVSIGD